jgi:hypothetical protein
MRIEIDVQMLWDAAENLDQSKRDVMPMTAGSQFHSGNFGVGRFSDRISGAEEPEKIEMVLLTKDMDQSREGLEVSFLGFPSTLLFFTSFCIDYLVLSRRWLRITLSHQILLLLILE